VLPLPQADHGDFVFCVVAAHCPAAEWPFSFEGFALKQKSEEVVASMPPGR